MKLSGSFLIVDVYIFAVLYYNNTMNRKDNPLKKLIASNLYARYSGILSLSDISLFIADTNGNILLEFIPSPEFCTHVCQERGGRVCPDYSCRFNPESEGSFVCRYGLENILIPIKADHETLGYIGGMQVYLPETEYQKYMIDMQSLQGEKNPEREYIAKSISSLKTVEVNKIKIHEQLCGHIAKNISLDLTESISHDDSDVARLSIEKEILEKKIIDLEAKNMSLVINPIFCSIR